MSLFDRARSQINMVENMLQAQMDIVSTEVAKLALMIGDGTIPPPPDDTTDPRTILDLKNWTCTLSTGSPGDPDNDYVKGAIPGHVFVRNDGVVFRTDVNGVTTEHSDYCRDELRQMNDDHWTPSKWPSSGSHAMMFEESIDVSHLVARKRIVGAQIHDGGDDVCQIIYDASQGLIFSHNDGKSIITIDRDYVNNTRYVGRLVAASNRIQFYYNTVKVVDIPKKGTSWYFKIGDYTQTGGNSEHDEPAGAYGEVTVYRLAVNGTN